MGQVRYLHQHVDQYTYEEKDRFDIAVLNVRIIGAWI